MIAADFANELVWRIGWTLLHSLWQIALLGLVLWAVLLLMRKRSANVRYWLACCGLAVCYLPLVYTFIQAAPEPDESPARKIVATSVVDQGGMPNVEPEGPMNPAPAVLRGNNYNPAGNDAAMLTEPGILPISVIAEHEPGSLPKYLKGLISPWVSWLVGCWLAGVCLFAIWNVGGWLLVQRMRRQGTPVSAHVIQERAMVLLERMRIGQAVRFLESLAVEVPVVIGWLKPVILLPAGLITRLTPEQVEAVIAHELAHIRRHDYLINLLQTLTESLLFYHPVVWWLSNRIRVEREYCCDDEAIAASGDRNRYVTALAAVETARLASVHALSLAGSRDGSTLSRMRRLMGVTPIGSQGWIAGVSMIAVLLCLGLTVGLSQSRDLPEVTNALSQQQRAKAEAPPVVPAPHADQSANQGTVPFSRPFRLDLTYYGESDKPFYKYSLHNNLKNAEVNGVQLDESAVDYRQDLDQLSERSVDWLNRSGFFQHAQEIDPAAATSPERTSQGYLLRVRLGDRVWEEDLGFNLGTLLRLESLQNVFTSAELKVLRDPDKPFGLELLLSRLSGYKQIWMEGQLKGDLKLQVSSDQNQYPAGTAVPVKAELKNTGIQPESYEHHILSLVPSSIFIYDEFGRRVPYVGGTSQIQSHTESLAAGKTVALDQFDLAEFNYLRRPGHYLMYAVHGNGMRSNNLSFEIMRNSEPKPDFVGRLLPLMHDDWILVANPNFQGEIHPGKNFSKVEGFPVRFQCSPTSSIRDISHVWLYLTNTRAEGLETPIEQHFLPDTNYLGQIGEHHLYAHADEKSRQRWPDVLDQARKALRRHSDEEQYLEALRDFKQLLQDQNEVQKLLKNEEDKQNPKPAPQQNDPISLLIRRLEKSHGLWMNGVYPEIKLPKTATPDEVLSAAVKLCTFDKGKIEKYRVIDRHNGFSIGGDPQQQYKAVSIESDQGDKILLMCYEPGLEDWWTRFYDKPALPNEEVLWGKPAQGIQVAIISQKNHWAANETPELKLSVRNTSKEPVSFWLYPGFFEIEWDGTWYLWGPVGFSDGHVNVPPGETVSPDWTLTLTHNDPRRCTRSGEPLKLKPGKHTVRIQLQCIKHRANPISHPVELTITKAKENDVNE